ncbi:LAO/AO transport system kinase [Desulfacinum hydrothermale DSM 13146]|uniref:LAO/AO transport system kinase n=1 Tax=Desulfacinum hydrothermale DSM 13146 TaxID=1121390 RepID=A0A1W1X173_9BACT|nr:methylmalonyl Co-A mutase-associated GTPase MeaB [Desulfacinum hydrothermale]SMC17478.1 LAO/AO transport system kinase [Desulfacinum hydrothermale DSM 13146]
MRDYAKEVLEGSVRAAARLISWLEDEDPRALEHMERLYAHTGRAYVMGITGSPGAGKSTLTDKVTFALRKKGLTVGIVAVDPSSPFTGGAVLGDRVRMSRLTMDPGVFMRSMATRGFLGGLAKATGEVVKVLDALGKDVILIETVGVGQDEVDVIRLADTTCLVLVPGLGDTIQSMKAGVMEIADVFVINKADRPGADQLYAEVTTRVEQDASIRERAWTPPVMRTVAVDDEGIGDLVEAVEAHRKFLEESGALEEKRRRRAREETLQLIHGELYRRIRDRLTANGELDALVEAIVQRRESPYRAMQHVVARWMRE